MLAGRFRDPLVGRDILVGATAAATLEVVAVFGGLASGWLGRAPSPLHVGELSTLFGVPQLLGRTLDKLVHAQAPAMGILFLLFRGAFRPVGTMSCPDSIRRSARVEPGKDRGKSGSLRTENTPTIFLTAPIDRHLSLPATLRTAVSQATAIIVCSTPRDHYQEHDGYGQP